MQFNWLFKGRKETLMKEEIKAKAVKETLDLLYKGGALVTPSSKIYLQDGRFKAQVNISASEVLAAVHAWAEDYANNSAELQDFIVLGYKDSITPEALGSY